MLGRHGEAVIADPYDLRRIAAQIERWARYDDVPAPGLDDADLLRGAANEIERLRDRHIRLMELASRADWEENDAEA